METSHPAVVENQPHSTPLFSIEVEASVFKRLSTLATKEGIGINELGSALIKRLLLLHRTEVGRVIDELKRRNHRCQTS